MGKLTQFLIVLCISGMALLCGSNAYSQGPAVITISASDGSTLTMFDVYDALIAFKNANPTYGTIYTYVATCDASVQIIDVSVINSGEYYFYYDNNDVRPQCLSVIGNYVTEIRETAFASLYSLQYVSFPQLVSIGRAAFHDCRSLTSVTLPQAEIIGELAFGWCPNLTSVNLPSARSIGYLAFGNCPALEILYIPQAETLDESYASCSSLAKLTILTEDAEFTGYEGAYWHNIPESLTIYMLNEEVIAHYIAKYPFLERFNLQVYVPPYEPTCNDYCNTASIYYNANLCAECNPTGPGNGNLNQGPGNNNGNGNQNPGSSNNGNDNPNQGPGNNNGNGNQNPGNNGNDNPNQGPGNNNGNNNPNQGPGNNNGNGKK